MRLLATADLHYNHAHSRPLADELIERINAMENVDALLLIGDTAGSEGSVLEECLARFRFAGPKLFVAGNHELWTHGEDSYHLLTDELPRRVRSAGWHWLQTEPFVLGPCAIVGSVGWYDYSFEVKELGIPKRFYEHKIAPGSAAQYEELAGLMGDDIPPAAMEVFARWNDGRFVKLHRTDEEFLDELMRQMESQLTSLAGLEHITVAIHHLPFDQLIPIVKGSQWEFARAFLGSRRMGEMLLRHPNVRQVLCGHSHFATEAQVEHIHVVNIGSGYRRKTYRIMEIPSFGF